MKVSVLMPAYNAARYLRQSIGSVLDQTFENFELLVVDDASTDGTAAYLATLRDPRVRVLHNPVNLGIVKSGNRLMQEARGEYIARLDADDICYPSRLKSQVSYLDSNPHIVLVGTGNADLEDGHVRPRRRMPERDPNVLRWLLQIGNPVCHSSIMFRRSTSDKLSSYLREDYQYAEDFDFIHRMLDLGPISILPTTLILYRLHGTNSSRTRRNEMISRTSAVLANSFGTLLRREAPHEAGLVATHLFAGIPVESPERLRSLGHVLDEVLDAFLKHHKLDRAQHAECQKQTAQAWWRVLESSLRSGNAVDVATSWSSFSVSGSSKPALHQLAKSALQGSVPGKSLVKKQLQRLAPILRTRVAEPRTFNVNGATFTSVPPRADELPSLTVVVDTEAEFDWSKPFDRSLTAVRGMAAQEPVQEIFDGFGLRPIYVVDYAVASQTEGYEPLRRILARRGCVIGAHLHPWITPPFEEAVNDHNSYGGNLPPALEAAKLQALVAAIEAAFGVRPLFFKAGRYGLGPHTLETLARMGFEVDFSIMPLADLRKRGGGADFRFAGIQPCRARPDGILCVPMTRSQIGLLAPLPPWLHGALHSETGQHLRLPGLLSRLGLVNTITLTPEGVTATEQKLLLRKLVEAGHRRFVLHYHSPSLLPGNTSYVRTAEDLHEFKHRLQSVCSYFFEELGGLPGHPADLLHDGARDRLWPPPPAA